MKPHSDSCVLLFAKSPVKGQVKTRLAAEIGEDFALGLYKCFVEDLLARIEDIGVPLRLCFHPPRAKSDFMEWFGERDFYRPQTGDNLGERLMNAFDNTFREGFSKVVAIGSDSPDLPADFLLRALKGLESHDAVVGPSSDGGYYLIGFSQKSFLPGAFEGIAWSTPAVCEQTLATLKRHERSVYLLPEWHDVDTAADLDSLLLRTGNAQLERSRTYHYLMANGLRSEPNV